MKHIIAMIMTLSVFANLAFAEQERVSREEWRIGVGGFYTKQDFPVFNSNSVSSFGDMSAYGGYIIGGGDYFYKRFKIQVFIEAHFGNSTQGSFSSRDGWLKFGFNTLSSQNPLYVNIGFFGDSGATGSTRDNDRVQASTNALTLGIDGWLSAGERLRWEYSADYDYITSKKYAYSTGANTFAGYYSGGDGSYGLRASVGFSYQFKDDLFYYVKLRAKYQNVTYNPTLPTANNLVGMLEIGIGGR